MEELVGAAAAIVSTICWLPQTLKTWRTRETKDLSLPANLLIFFSISLWLIYGLMLGAWPLIAANAIAVILVGAIVAAKLKFG
ncbi:SemiSWEET family sugar transporter [Aliiroseovarius lamellibrachiae]|uniref:SemiSWEET family sugar transporter n=1 Tax=Aliiroseovarius lamellibrachiae TaxID=1924933 RepID=UPI001BDF7F20|nr:SemiSWEET transporter [Aliiroseovarius lamellibrachiae]MBT2132225.1 SemiSWEET transporter [Aliiroseovarius lamellibrachiae]